MFIKVAPLRHIDKESYIPLVMHQNHNKGPHLRQFERALAHYKARVYESCFLASPKPGVAIEDWIGSPADRSNILVIDDKAEEWVLFRWVLQEQFPAATLT